MDWICHAVAAKLRERRARLNPAMARGEGVFKLGLKHLLLALVSMGLATSLVKAETLGGEHVRTSLMHPYLGQIVMSQQDEADTASQSKFPPPSPTPSTESKSGPPPQTSADDGVTAAPVTSPNSLCLALSREAVAHDLPVQFFTRLIWQESRFDPLARSHVGAQGIAQFMPGTARWRGLADPFEPYQALYESARWVQELRHQFGNLGLAAAAYNAGPKRVQDWLHDRGKLPAETRSYVRIVTGRSADEWARAGAVDQAGPRMEDHISCNEIRFVQSVRTFRQLLQSNTERLQGQTDHAPWALQLIGDSSEIRAMAQYRGLQKRFSSLLTDRSPVIVRNQVGARGSAYWIRIRVAETTRERATQLCSKLQAKGGSCLVVRN